MTKDREKEQRKVIKLLAMKKLAENDFWYFCKAMDSKFFTNDKAYLKDLCDKLQYFHDCPNEEYDTLVLSMPPRTGKTYVLSLYEVYCKCKNPKSKSIIVCYNNELSLNFSRNVRNKIKEEKMNKNALVVSDIFEKVKIVKDAAAKKMWSLAGSDQINFLASSPKGTLTGMAASGQGGNIIIDDLVKNSYEAFSDKILNSHWDFFTQTLLSRQEIGAKLIICFTRWSKSDLIARFDEWCEREKKTNVMHVCYKMEQPDGSVLHPSIMSQKTMEERKKMIGPEIWAANYQQEPIEIKDRLYKSFNCYFLQEKDEWGKIKKPRDEYGNEIPINLDYYKVENAESFRNGSFFERIFLNVDTADTGEDYLCAIAYGVKNNRAYVLDVLYTQEPQEITEPLVADMIYKNNVSYVAIESNNGGRAFYRNVRRIYEEKHANAYVQWEPYTQSKQKLARICGESVNVMRLFYFPFNWEYLFNDFYKEIINFKRTTKQDHDDGADTLTACYETAYTLGYLD